MLDIERSHLGCGLVVATVGDFLCLPVLYEEQRHTGLLGQEGRRTRKKYVHIRH